MSAYADAIQSDFNLLVHMLMLTEVFPSPHFKAKEAESSAYADVYLYRTSLLTGLYVRFFLGNLDSSSFILDFQIGAFAAPDKIHWAPGLPKTRSGKIMRRILRKIASRQLDQLGDTSTLADPNVVNQLIELADC